MIGTHHHVDGYVRTVHADRLAAASSERRPTADLERLVATAAAGDEIAWATLVSRFQPHLLRVARAHGLNAPEAEDAVQDTWLRLMRSIAAVRDPLALAGWLTTTTRRESLRVRERRSRERPTADDPRDAFAATDDADARLEAEACRAAVSRALETLPVRHRQLLRALFDDAAGSYDDIARDLDMPVGSIGPIRGRCFARLRHNAQLRQLADAVD
jgi:RNA polymerase sigma factor (sigma-70 family)